MMNPYDTAEIKRSVCKTTSFKKPFLPHMHFNVLPNWGDMIVGLSSCLTLMLVCRYNLSVISSSKNQNI